MLPRMKVLFLCTGNTCRSQMAEAWARKLHPSRFEAYSAGTVPGQIDPRAVQVMAEEGIDISGHHSKHVKHLVQLDFDNVITVCDSAKEACPVFTGNARRIHVSFDDPPRIAASASSEEEALAPYRRVRDEIRDYVVNLPELVAGRPSGEGGSGGDS